MADHDQIQNSDGALAPRQGGEPVARTYYSPAPTGDLEDTDWQHIASVVWRRKWWVLAAVLLCTAAGIAYASSTPRVYEAEATVWIDRSLSEEARVSSPEILTGEGWAAFLHSARVLIPVAMDQKRYLSPEDPYRSRDPVFADFQLEDGLVPGKYRLDVGEEGSYRLLRKQSTLPPSLDFLSGLGMFEEEVTVEEGRVDDTIGAEAGFAWRPPASELEPGTEIGFEVRTPRKAALGLGSQLTALFNSETGFMTVRLQGSDAESAASTLNLVLDRFVETATGMRGARLARVVETLEQRQQQTAAELEEAEQNLAQLNQGDIPLTLSRTAESGEAGTPGGMAGGGDDAAGTLLGSYFDAMARTRQLQTDISRLERTLEAIRSGNPIDVAELRTIPPEYRPETLGTALTDLAEAQTRRRQLLRTYTEQHPDVQDVTREIERIREETFPPLLQESIRVLENRREALEQQIANQRSQLQQAASGNVEERRLWREYTRTEERYAEILANLGDARLARVTELPEISVLDRATPPSEPANNRIPQILALASLGGLALGIGGALLHDRMDRRIREPETITTGLGIPLLGVIPRLDSPSPAHDNAAQVAIAAFRSLRVQIEGAARRNGGMLTITSPGLRDGKSTVAANLAVSYANAGYDTILVDADVHRGLLDGMFSVAGRPGLTEWLMEDATLERVCRDTFIPGLTILPCGRRSHQVAELLQGARADDLFRRLRERYDAVVVDVPPLSAGSDALVIGESSDKVLLVLRSGGTDRRMTEVQLEMMHNFQIPLVGAVMNAVPSTESFYHYYTAEEYYHALEVPA